MIAPARIALLKDSYYQVMDNWVFRILAVICFVFVMIPFIVGFRENGIVVFFGVLDWSYEEIMSTFGGAGDSSFQSADVREQAIAIYMDVIVQKLVGNMGVLFSIAATAFFVPQMLEKGAADVLLHKPLGRASFYLSRYFSGVLFVAILSTILAVGTYLGFLVSSGHNDLGILMGAPLMTYVFALIFSVAMLVGVLTRSTVAAILLTCIFFVLNGCVDTAWVSKTEIDLQLARSGVSLLGRGRESKMEALSEKAEASDSEEDDSELDEDDSPILDMLWNVLCGFHYVLPKTGDADVIAKKLRSQINAPPFREEGSRLSLAHLPENMQMLEASQGRAPSEWHPTEAELLGEARLLLESDGDEKGVRYTLFRRPATKTERVRKERRSISTENTSKASKLLHAQIVDRLAQERDVAEDAKEDLVERKSSRFAGRGISGYRLSWQTESGAGRQAVLFRVGLEWIYTLVIEDESTEQSEERAAEVLDRVGHEMGFDASVGAYEEAFSFDAPWRYNIFFSLGSSLAFVLLTLLLGWWRLTRIDF